MAQQSVQAAHAVLEAARSGLISSEQAHPHLVLCGVKSELALMRQYARLLAAGIRVQPFHEPDRNGELTAIATEPLRDGSRNHMKHLRLLEN